MYSSDCFIVSSVLIVAQSNILIHHDKRIDDDYHIRVTDFGLSLVGDATKGAFSTTGSGRGSEGWIAPELYSDDKSPLAPQCEATDMITAHHGQGALRGQDAADVL
jgi:serine/threonine protein kinase